MGSLVNCWGHSEFENLTNSRWMECFDDQSDGNIEYQGPKMAPEQ